MGASNRPTVGQGCRGGTEPARVHGARPLGDGGSGESEVSHDQEGRGGHEGPAGGVHGAAPLDRGDRQRGVE